MFKLIPSSIISINKHEKANTEEIAREEMFVRELMPEELFKVSGGIAVAIIIAVR